MHLRIRQEGFHHFVHAMVERGGEQHDLRVERNLAEQSLDWREEAHIGHFVGLINNRDLNLVQGERACSIKSSRRPGQATTISAPA